MTGAKEGDKVKVVNPESSSCLEPWGEALEAGEPVWIPGSQDVVGFSTIFYHETIWGCPKKTRNLG